jgi:GH24 family phage-related lysozyme (muramidase)
MTNPAPITLDQLFRHYKALPHQMAAVMELQDDLKANGYDVVMRRDRPWFKIWSQDGKQTDLSAALKLIQEFEGCHLDAYLCPADVATIGWGNTRYSDGRPVKLGDKINRIEADMMLRQEVDRIAATLRNAVPYWLEMADEQRSALVSFAYNLGAGFYGAKGFETITARLRDKDWRRVPEAMLLYRNPGSKFETGLRRRRIAEGNLWAKGLPEVQQDIAKLSPSSPFTARLTPHIRIGEFALDQEARRFQHQHQVDTAGELAAFLERARTAFGGNPVIITSGYRPAAINRAVGGASGSEHLYGTPGVGAVDWYIKNVDIYKLQAWCLREWPYSTGKGASRGFIHTGIRSGRPKVVWDY